MMTLCRLFAILAGLAFLSAAPSVSRAEIQAESAANYIHDLFDTSMRSDANPRLLCPQVEQFGRSAAGRAWQLLPPAERARFRDGFCNLAVDAVTRLRSTYPDLNLKLGRVVPAPQGMVLVATSIALSAGASAWQVDWQVAAANGHLRLADLRIVGLSFGIFLRSLANAEITGSSANAEGILARWRQALDRALPPDGKRPESPPK